MQKKEKDALELVRILRTSLRSSGRGASNPILTPDPPPQPQQAFLWSVVWTTYSTKSNWSLSTQLSDFLANSTALKLDNLYKQIKRWYLYDAKWKRQWRELQIIEKIGSLAKEKRQRISINMTESTKETWFISRNRCVSHSPNGHEQTTRMGALQCSQNKPWEWELLGVPRLCLLSYEGVGRAH